MLKIHELKRIHSTLDWSSGEAVVGYVVRPYWNISVS